MRARIFPFLVLLVVCLLGTAGGTAFAQVCGNGLVESPETCDDGHTATGDCCGATCQYSSSGTSCTSDGNSCTTDRCDAAGHCLHTSLAAGTLCTEDGNPCTADLCDSGATCTHAAGNAGVACRVGDGNRCAPRKVPAGKLTLPAGISQAWFYSRQCGPNSVVRLYPSGQQGEIPTQPQLACAGWHTYSEIPASASKLRTILASLRAGTYATPAAEIDVTRLNFTGGTVATAFNDMKLLYEANKDANGNWTVLLPIYDAADCSTPFGPIGIVGFTKATIFSVSQNATIDAHVDCGTIDYGDTGGSNYGTVVSPCPNCDVIERCDGTSTICPADVKIDAGTACFTDNKICTADVCDGSGTCTHAAGNEGTPCRGSTDACDPAETCSGTSVACPVDSLATTSVVCRPASDACDAAEMCTGSGASCPADSLTASTEICRPAAGDCDVEETCTGTSGACPFDAKRLSGTACTSDNEICTDDRCDDLGSCTHADNAVACNDGLFCNGGDTCSGGTCSAHSGNPCAGIDGDGNCAESCDETADACQASDPDGAICDDGDDTTVLDECLAGTCSGTTVISCGDDDGVCPDDCSMEMDGDCNVCLTRTIGLVECSVKVTRRRNPDGTDRMSIKCDIDGCSATDGISPSSEGLDLAVVDASGPCFRDRLTASECVATATGYRCSPADRADPGIHVLKLKARSTCDYSLRVKLTASDLACLDSMQSPWVPSLVVGDDCGDVECPIVVPDKATCAEL